MTAWWLGVGRFALPETESSAPDLAGIEMAGYHTQDIPKGKVGLSSKIMEELLELQDAESQSCRIMQLLELSDIYGALEAYLDKHFPGFNLDDLRAMSNITKRAFQSGHRRNRED